MAPILTRLGQSFGFGAPSGGAAIDEQFVEASGGIVSEYTESGNIYRSHAFTSSGTFTIEVKAENDANNTFDYFLVGGGGGGGGRHAGGGGAGGIRSGTGIPESSTGDIAVTIGLGGWAATWGDGTIGNGPGFQGGNSSIAFTPGTITAYGGGGGRGSAAGTQATANGGSGGGGGYPNILHGYGYNPTTPGPVIGAVPLPSPYPITQGYNGGVACEPPTHSGGGGGGAAEVGYNAPNSAGGNGGAGINNSLFTGSNIAYAGGGGGGSYFNSAPTRGKGGGPSGPNAFGAGDGAAGTDYASHGVNNLGGGGGGSGGGSWPSNGKAAAGGSGLGVIRYKIGTTSTAKCSGGAISFYNGKTIHTYVNSGTFVMPGTFSGTLEWVLVGGGGAGSHGGGGAGGYVVGSTPYTAPSPKSFTVTIGQGGKGDKRDRNNSYLTASGTNTEFYETSVGPMSHSGWAAMRGGPGGNLGNEPVTTGYPGGSGGGGARYGGGKPGGSSTQAPWPNPGNTINIGYAGGTATDAPQYGGGGGGGAGGVGTNASNSATPWSPTGGGGPGGLGVQLPATFRDPKSSVGVPGPGGTKWWVCGGGGGGLDIVSGSPGNMAGGGGGQTSPLKADSWAGGGGGATSPTAVGDGVDGTGGGGGGAMVDPWNSVYAKSGDGGSGLVLLAYPT